MGEKRRMGIEAVLSWAYRDELPREVRRVPAGPETWRRAWGGVEHYAEVLALIDEENLWGLAPDLSARAAPHPDAERVGAAVAALDERMLGLPEGWQPLEDMLGRGMDDLVQDAVRRGLHEATTRAGTGEQMLRRPPRYLLVRYALLRSCPIWRADMPERMIEMANGKPRWFRRIEIVTADGERYEQEVDGYNRVAKRPFAGAYCKPYLDPDPIEAVHGRIDYEVWRVALDIVTESLGELETIEVVPCTRPARPWLEEESRSQRLLPSMLTAPGPDYSGVTVAMHYGRRRA